MKEIEYIKAIRAKIEQGWTQHTSARNIRGESLPFHCYDYAVKWCLGGAMKAVYRDYSTNAVAKTSERVSTVVCNHIIDSGLGPKDGSNAILHYNDHPDRTKQDVLSLLDAIIAKLENKQ